MSLTRRGTTLLFLALSLGGCAIEPFRPEPPAATATAQSATTAAAAPAAAAAVETGAGPVITSPAPAAETPVEESAVEVPALPAPTTPAERPQRKVPPPKLGPATTALVNQASAQRKRGDLPGAQLSLERALRIEPSNPLLWIEMGRLRMDQRNYAQAEAMGRKAIAMLAGDARTQSTAWTLVADSLQARGRNAQAQEAREKSKQLATLP